MRKAPGLAWPAADGSVCLSVCVRVAIGRCVSFVLHVWMLCMLHR